MIVFNVGIRGYMMNFSNNALLAESDNHMIFSEKALPDTELDAWVRYLLITTLLSAAVAALFVVF